MRISPSEEVCVSSEPVPWWNLRARAEHHRNPNPVPEAQSGDLYVEYGSARDAWGNVRFVLYWHEPWCVIGKKGVTSGTVKAQFFYCDDQPLHPHWLARYTRVISWPSGQDITDIIREPSQWP
jgi:hypothetical protein